MNYTVNLTVPWFTKMKNFHSIKKSYNMAPHYNVYSSLPVIQQGKRSGVIFVDMSP